MGMEGPFGQTPAPQEEVEITREQVIESLRATPGDFSLVREFLNQREATFDKTKPVDLDYLQLDITQAEIYRDAGLINEAKEAFESNLMIAEQVAEKLGRVDLIEYCESELAKLG